MNIERRRICFVLMLCAGIFALTSPALAHDPSKSYVNLVIGTNQINGQWDMPLTDLQTVVAMDEDKDGFISWEEVRDSYKSVIHYAEAHFLAAADGVPLKISFPEGDPNVEDFSDGTYVDLPLQIELASTPHTLEVGYTAFFETNSLHRGLLRLEFETNVQSVIFSPEKPSRELRLGPANQGHQFVEFLREGIGHIWTGYDHILFLLALLLPAVLRRDAGTWAAVNAFQPAFLNVIKIVTAFTVAHSLTLSLATLNIVRLPSRLTESAIAASVVLAALNNLRPVVRDSGWIVAFGFGLIHGFGFANALSELGLKNAGMLVVLVGFNLGVELGQLAIVSTFLPAAYLARNTEFYKRPVLRGGSLVIIAIASAWLTERVLDMKFMPF